MKSTTIIGLCLALSAPTCLSLKLANTTKTSDAVVKLCALPNPLGHAMFLGNDEELSKAKEQPSSTDEKKVALKEAIVDYKTKMESFKAAEAKVMGAMEALLKVPSVDTTVLTKTLEGGEKHSLIVFYAPWCPHCQTFVLHNGEGDPTKAPLELMRTEFAENEKTKSVTVMRADVEKLGPTGIPTDFDVQAIPTVYMVSKQGVPTKFEGDPHDATQLKTFVESIAAGKNAESGGHLGSLGA